nr:MAG TPA: SOS-response transcriptional repressors (RecA-mediated autopeptidases) [Caudoviricetes sp.]
MNFDRLDELRKKHGVSNSFLCDLVGRKRYYINDCRNKGTVIPDEYIKKWAHALHTTPEYLNGETDDPTPKLPFQTFPLSESTVSMIPIVSTVRAGWNGVPEPVYDGMMAVYDQKNPQEYVWMKVEGDSMEPYLMNGDLVLVHVQPTAENGEIVVAMLDGEEGTVKKYQRNASGVMLIPFNSKCPTVFVSNDRLDAFLIYGVVKKSMRNYT